MYQATRALSNLVDPLFNRRWLYVMGWPLSEFFIGLNNFNGRFSLGESGMSKSGKHGGNTSSSTCSMSPSVYRNTDKFFGNDSEMQCSVRYRSCYPHGRPQ